MRLEASICSLSWIPSEAVAGPGRLAFDAGITHYDQAPPDDLGHDFAAALIALREADRFRFANHLAAWIEVDDRGRVTGSGYDGGGAIGSTTVRVGPARATFNAFSLDDIRHPPQIGDGFVRFVQTSGGRTGLPAPRRVRRKPFVQFRAPLAWTTLALVIHSDGRSEFEVVGASPFPRHWIYGSDGRLAAKVGLTQFENWWRNAFGTHTPWGDEESPALVTAAETALERELAGYIMHGSGKPTLRNIEAGAALTHEGEPGDEIYLLLDGVLRVEVGGERIAEVGPGALLGERAVLEGGTRTSTLTAVTPCRVAVAGAAQLDRAKLAEVSQGHRREESAIG